MYVGSIRVRAVNVLPGPLGLTGARTYEQGESHAKASHDDFFVELLICRETFVAAQWDIRPCLGAFHIELRTSMPRSDVSLGSDSPASRPSDTANRSI